MCTMGKVYYNFAIFLIISTLKLQKHSTSGAVFRNGFDKTNRIDSNEEIVSDDREKGRNPSPDPILVGVSSGNTNPTYTGNLTPNLNGSIGTNGTSFGSVDQILGAAPSYKPQVSPSSSSFSDIQQAQQLSLPSASSPQEFADELLSQAGGWTMPTESDFESIIPTLLMEASLNVGIAAAVSSSHTESVYLEGDHENPAIANLLFGSDSHYGVGGSTFQASSGNGSGSQHSEGNIDGGTSQMYNISMMGEHNEVSVTGSSDAMGSGSLTQQSLSDFILNETQQPQNTYQTAAETLQEPLEEEQLFQQSYPIQAEAVENLDNQEEEEQLFQQSQPVQAETVESLDNQEEEEQHFQEAEIELSAENANEQTEEEQHFQEAEIELSAENANEQTEEEQLSLDSPGYAEETLNENDAEVQTDIANSIAEELSLNSDINFPYTADTNIDYDNDEDQKYDGLISAVLQ